MPDLPTILLAFGVGFSYQLGLDDVDKSGDQRSVEDSATGAASGTTIGLVGGSRHREEKGVWSTSSFGEDARGKHSNCRWQENFRSNVRAAGAGTGQTSIR